MPDALSIDSVLRLLMPTGTRGGGNPPSWLECPLWPPDVFAITATIAEKSGCYAEPGVVLSRNNRERSEKKHWAEKSYQLGAKWSNAGNIPSEVSRLWSTIFRHRRQPLSIGSGRGLTWKRATMRLLAVADEACFGVGFIPDLPMKGISRTVFEEYLSFQLRRETNLQFPNSLSHLISASMLCVFPKSLSPGVGCTLRSLSEHLCLLPGTGLVEPLWDFSIPTSVARKGIGIDTYPDFHILLIPFPYSVLASDFEISRPPSNGADGYFRLNQGWLFYDGNPISAPELTLFVAALIRSAEHESGNVNAVVFPEAALSDGMTEAVATLLAGQFPQWSSLSLEFSARLAVQAATRRYSSRSQRERLQASFVKTSITDGLWMQLRSGSIISTVC